MIYITPPTHFGFTVARKTPVKLTTNSDCKNVTEKITTLFPLKNLLLILIATTLLKHLFHPNHQNNTVKNTVKSVKPP